VECIVAESTGGASHKVNDTESHFPKVAIVKIHIQVKMASIGLMHMLCATTFPHEADILQG